MRNIKTKNHQKSWMTATFFFAYEKDPIIGMHKWVMSFDLNSLYPHLIMQYNISPETLMGCPFKEKDITVDKMLDGEVKDSIMQSLKDKNVTLTPNGALFRKDIRGFLPELMQSIYDDRVKYKRLLLEAKQEYENTKDPKLKKDISRYDNIQMAKKISLNSAYGAIGNNWLLWWYIWYIWSA